MHITNLNERFDGRLHYNTGRRLNNGFIRNGHNVLTLSDRDIIHNYKSIKDFSGKITLQNKIFDYERGIRKYGDMKCGIPKKDIFVHWDLVTQQAEYVNKQTGQVKGNARDHNNYWAR